MYRNSELIKVHGFWKRPEIDPDDFWEEKKLKLKKLRKLCKMQKYTY